MKALVTQYHALDIKDLVRGHYLYPFCSFEWVWQSNRDRQAVSIRITMLDGLLQVLLPTDLQQIPQDIQLTYSLSSNGRKRPWFVCPACHQRVGVLYHQVNLSFLCRRCHGLAYPSQYRSKRHGHGRSHRLVAQRDRERLERRIADDFECNNRDKTGINTKAFDARSEHDFL